MLTQTQNPPRSLFCDIYFNKFFPILVFLLFIIFLNLVTMCVLMSDETIHLTGGFRKPIARHAHQATVFVQFIGLYEHIGPIKCMNEEECNLIYIIFLSFK